MSNLLFENKYFTIACEAYNKCSMRFNEGIQNIQDVNELINFFLNYIEYMENCKEEYKSIKLYIPASILEYLLTYITDRKYIPHHIEHNNTYVYYLWIDPTSPDCEPPYSTCTGGIAAIILSPDEKKILLVDEYDKFKLVTGGVDLNETCIQTAKRESYEEVGIKADPNYESKICGGWSIASVHPSGLNDILVAVSLRSTSDEFKPDGTEIKVANWFDIEYLTQIIKNMDKEQLIGNISYGYIVHDGIRLSYSSLKFIENYLTNRNPLIHVDKNDTNIVLMY